jgi:hypothetical protein
MWRDASINLSRRTGAAVVLWATIGRTFRPCRQAAEALMLLSANSKSIVVPQNVSRMFHDRTGTQGRSK